MKREEVITKFIGFYKDKGHHHYPKSSLIREEGDTLFTIAGMIPFKEELEGVKKPRERRES